MIINKSDLVEWFKLNNLQFTEVQNGYVIHISDKVGCLLTFRGMSNPSLMNQGNYLYSLALKKVINHKDSLTSVVMATTEMASQFIEHWRKIYEEKMHFYEVQLHMTDTEKVNYQIQMSMKIQAKPDYDKSPFLKELLDKVSKGQVLSPKTVQAIDNSTSASALTEQQINFQKRIEIDALCQASKEKGDDWTAGFTKTLLESISKYGSKTTFTEKQKQILQDKFAKYSI